MGTRIESPVEDFPGFVILKSPLTLPQVIAIQDAWDAVKLLGDDITSAKQNYALLPALIACVDKWDIEWHHEIPDPPTPETFPASPAIASGELVNWLIKEISLLLYEAEETDPK